MNGNEKNAAIRCTLKSTMERRRGQICKQYELKIDRSHLNQKSERNLNRVFLEAKWFYNSILASQDVFFLSKDHYKTKEVQVKVKNRFETRELKCLSSQMKQEIIDRTKDSMP